MSKHLVPSHLLVPAGTGSLDAYIQEVNKIPVLTIEEEQDLARRYRDDGDLEAARRMVLAHLRFVVHVAKGYTGYGLPLGDLVHELQRSRMILDPTPETHNCLSASGPRSNGLARPARQSEWVRSQRHASAALCR